MHLNNDLRIVNFSSPKTIYINNNLNKNYVAGSVECGESFYLTCNFDKILNDTVFFMECLKKDYNQSVNHG